MLDIQKPSICTYMYARRTQAKHNICMYMLGIIKVSIKMLGSTYAASFESINSGCLGKIKCFNLDAPLLDHLF